MCRSLSKAARASSVGVAAVGDDAVSASMRRAARARRAAARPHKAAAIAQNTAAAASHGRANMPTTLLTRSRRSPARVRSPAGADPEHQRGRAEVEVLADAPLQVPQIGRPGMVRVANRVKVGGSVAPWVAYRTRPPGERWAAWASASSRLSSPVGTRRWAAASDVPQGRIQPVHAQAGAGADLEHRGVGEKAPGGPRHPRAPGPAARRRAAPTCSG